MNEKEVRKVLTEWKTISRNKENKELYEVRLKFLRDYLSYQIGEQRIGREECLKEGKKKVLFKVNTN
ncbi:hypothetical protein ACIQD3_03025 [Peribacillus loiseleuriae]|uniref:hypothetical protein n=1 Tax=Peribacillus loiseleuriae TaxID=1679170 RepID=UPI00381568B4